MSKTNTILLKALKINEITLPSTQIDQLSEYLTLIQQWNRVYNLTAITEPLAMAYLHIIDSLLVSPYLHGSHMLDVGTGAGLPGIPLAIVHPDHKWTLLDKSQKKTRFLIQANASLHLKNVAIVTTSIEDFHPAVGFDSILSRALGSIRNLVTMSAHLLNKQGMIIAMKGKYPSQELNQIPDDFYIVDVIRLSMIGRDVERHLVCLKRKLPIRGSQGG
mgnify:CR=1 FL=1